MAYSFSSYATLSAVEVEKKFDVEVSKGLTTEQVAAARARYGKNVLHARETTWWQILFRQFSSPFIYLLFAAAILCVVLKEPLDAIFIFIFVVINTILGFLQEYRSENILKTLKKYLVSYTVVRRNHAEVRIEKSEIVPGDVIILEAGDVVPADLRIVEADHLEMNESVLTGESESVMKISDAATVNPKEMYQANNVAFCGTTVISGRGVGVVIATGASSVFGTISRLAGEARHESDFEKGMKSISRMILQIVAVTFIVLLGIKFFTSGESTNFFEFVIFSIVLAVSVIPEGLPLVITFTLSHGAKRLAENKVVVKRLSSIEDLGSIEVLCTDKTGTITENKTHIAALLPFRDTNDELLHYARLASVMPTTHMVVHPFDDAMYAGITPEEKKRLSTYSRVSEIPFDPTRRRNSVLVAAGDTKEVVVRGAPEEVLKLCTNVSVEENKIQKFMDGEGKKGHRVLAIARRMLGKTTACHIYDEERDLELVGCVSLYDPLKKSSIEAITRAKALGVQMKVLTGDSPEVAHSVGCQAGIITNEEKVITGATFVAASKDERKTLAEQYHIFARVSPEEKYEIIATLEETHVVGFLGEGINDAPALKHAHVGMVVDNASDVAREAADIILLQKNLLAIVKGIEEGRKVFANNIKYIKATMASNFGNFYALVVASFLASFLPMLPIQILLVNLLSDFPMMAIAADTVDAGELRTPRHYNIRDIIQVCLLLGAVSTVFDFMFFALFYKFGPEILRTNWFVASILTELIFLFSIRTRLPFWRARPAAKILTTMSFVAAAVTVVLPFLPNIGPFFHFVLPAPVHLLWIAGLLVLYLVCTESLKLLYYRKFSTRF